MFMSHINTIPKRGPFLEEMKTISYTASEEQKRIFIWEKSNRKDNFTEVVYSKHNCEVLNRRIEKAILEERKELLEAYTFEKTVTPIFVASLVCLNLCFMGEWSLSMLLMEAISVYFQIRAYQRSKGAYTTNIYLTRLIEELKEGNIQLSEEEMAFLGEEERATYEDDGELSIANALVVCNPKVLKKRFGEK